METVSNVVNAASKAIWGEQNTAQNETVGNETAGNEPVSGLQGKGTATEPFDQGNAENPADPTTKSNVDPISSNTDASKAQIPTNHDNVTTGGAPKPLENTEGTGVTGASAQKYEPKGGDVIPSESSNNPGAAPSSGAAPTEKQQGADRPKEVPEGDAADAVKSSKDDAEGALKKRDPNDHSGEPLKMHDGSEKKVPDTQAERRESKAGNPGGQEHGEEPKGTGEQWEKSTGLQADGGDFDATKPGAGKEADRLLEQKGIHKDEKGAMDHSPPASGSEGKEKVSKMEKLKDKLHIGHKKDKE